METGDAAREQELKNINSTIKGFAADFKKHDEKEMEKYDRYDAHLQEVNRTLQKVVDGMERFQEISDEQSSIQTKHADDVERYRVQYDDTLEAHKKDTANEFKAVNSKLNKGIGIIMAVISIAGTIVLVFNIMKDQQDAALIEKEKVLTEKATLVKEMADMKNLMNRNYGTIRGIRDGNTP